MSTAGAGLRVEWVGKRDDVLRITIDRAPVNAMTLDMFADLTRTFAELHGSRRARAVVLTASGSRAFCAGADVKELSQKTVEISIERSAVTRATFEAIRQSPVPVIAAVNGAAIGGGMVIAACCDLILAAAGTTFKLPEIQVGSLGGARHILTMVPEKVVRRLALTGEAITAEKLEAMGALYGVVPADELQDAAMALATRISDFAPGIVRLMRESITIATEMPVYGGYRIEQLFTGLAAGLPESREASVAFIEKRKPSWQ